MSDTNMDSYGDPKSTSQLFAVIDGEHLKYIAFDDHGFRNH